MTLVTLPLVPPAPAAPPGPAPPAAKLGTLPLEAFELPLRELVAPERAVLERDAAVDADAVGTAALLELEALDFSSWMPA